jgi:uncharacterized membrane protein
MLIASISSEWPPWLTHGLGWISLGIEITGVAIIALTAIITTATCLIQTARTKWSVQLYRQYRSSLGRGILLGLEFLVAADIIDTVAVNPTINSALVLGLIVLVRTFLSFALEVEINGRWPWRDTLSTRGKEQQ